MDRVTGLFPLWAVLISAAAIVYPAPLIPLKWAIVPLLGVVMFGMGVTLTPRDFTAIMKRPLTIALGVVLQFLLMPLIGWLLTRLLSLPLSLAVGVILVGAAPGGTASNVITYLARGDVALSITLTSISTILAVVMTPLLTWLYIGQLVAVPTGDMLLSILEIILVPVACGIFVNARWGGRLGSVKRLFPLISIVGIVLIIGVIVALNQSQLSTLVVPVVIAVILHNLLGLTGGYMVPKAFGFDSTICRTIAIEVGMQNSGLAVALAVKYFSPAAALPGALFSIWHNLSGAALASVWSRTGRPR
ncbi:MAG: bile acid:sodium symporter family protein [Candidatus Methylomirabilis oxygeniifera]|uniref:Solute/sodium symporter n=1 Tax=Methylomirabilis oxygeniifera TaxID=671143 RepID=D5MMK0_METO1|nr:MAG: bile acid:sodium symporter family protein [Candidatus Methylomirabilis oxyfera]CBE70122.1 Solute/sodium symporter precursor [Candidatus Methylomirabilis oxyfera]